METAALVLTAIVGVLHLAFMYMETAGWPIMGRRMRLSKEEIETTRVLAANQGAYNGGVALLVFWALATGNDPAAMALMVFIAAMGVVGAATASGSILIIQTAPAVLAIVVRLLSA